MGKLERFSVCCTLGLLRGSTTDEIIFCSRYGNIETLASLFGSIAAVELMSPMAFSGSVHNAAPGLVGQIRKEPIPHTALAAGAHTFEAGLVEAYTYLAAENLDDVVVTYADLPLPEPYREFETEDEPGLALALRLGREHDSEEDGFCVAPGRRGAVAVLDRLVQGKNKLTFGGGPWMQ